MDCAQAVAVLDEAGKLVSVLSFSDFRGLVAPMLPALRGLTVGAFLGNRNPLPEHQVLFINPFAAAILMPIPPTFLGVHPHIVSLHIGTV